MDDAPDAYHVLQVDVHALPAVIRAAYCALAKLYHPDGSAPDLDRMMAVNRAYEVLRDPERRRQYDRERSTDRVAAIPVGATRTARPATPRPPSNPMETSPILDFGRYIGWHVGDLARHDPDYLRWLARHSSGIRFRSAIAKVPPAEPNISRNSKSFV